MRTTLRRTRILWELYKPVRPLLFLYLASVLLGASVEGLTLLAIVPLFGGDSGRVVDMFESMLGAVGLDPTDQSLLALVGCLVVARALVKFLSTLLAGLMVRRQAVRLQVSLFRSYLEVEWDMAVNLTHGEVQLMLTGQSKRSADFLGQLVLLLESVVFVVGLTAAAVVVSPADTALALALIGSTGVIVMVIGNRVQSHAEGALQQSKAQASALIQFARGLPALRTFGVVRQAVAVVEDQAKAREALTFRSQRAAAFAVALPDLMFVLALLAVISVSFDSGEGLPAVTAIIALLYRISQYMKRFAGLSALQERLPDVRDVHRNQQLLKLRRGFDQSDLVDRDLVSGAIIAEDVSFRYRGTERWALEAVTLTVEPGEFIGLVGPSGGGKSTLAHLLVGLMAPSAGIVRVGSRGRSEVGLVGFVPQTPFIIEGTVADNIRWLRDIDDDAVVDAASRAGLEPVLERLPAGLDSNVAQEGLTLSGGERQRLALARALAGSPAVLVLDEATSALDSESEKLIQSSLESLRGDVTVVSVAHRLSTVMTADRIWVMEGGRVVENARPSVLLSQPESRFARLGALQGLSGNDR